MRQVTRLTAELDRARHERDGAIAERESLNQAMHQSGQALTVLREELPRRAAAETWLTRERDGLVTSLKRGAGKDHRARVAGRRALRLHRRAGAAPQCAGGTPQRPRQARAGARSDLARRQVEAALASPRVERAEIIHWPGRTGWWRRDPPPSRRAGCEVPSASARSPSSARLCERRASCTVIVNVMRVAGAHRRQPLDVVEPRRAERLGTGQHVVDGELHRHAQVCQPLAISPPQRLAARAFGVGVEPLRIPLRARTRRSRLRSGWPGPSTMTRPGVSSANFIARSLPGYCSVRFEMQPAVGLERAPVRRPVAAGGAPPLRRAPRARPPPCRAGRRRRCACRRIGEQRASVGVALAHPVLHVAPRRARHPRDTRD